MKKLIACIQINKQSTLSHPSLAHLILLGLPERERKGERERRREKGRKNEKGGQRSKKKKKEFKIVFAIEFPFLGLKDGRGLGDYSPPEGIRTLVMKKFRSLLCFKGRQKKTPSFQNQSLSSFMLHMVPLSRIFYFGFCKGNLRVQSYLLVSHISNVDFV